MFLILLKEVGKTLFEQDFFYRVYAGGAEHILYPCPMPGTGNMERVFRKAAYAVFFAVGVGFVRNMIKGAIFYNGKSKKSNIKTLNSQSKTA